MVLSFKLLLSIVTGSDNPGTDGTSDQDSEHPDLPWKEDKVPDPVDSESDPFLVDSVLNGILPGVDLPFDLEDTVQCREIDVLESSVPGILFLLWLPKIDEWEQLNITIIVNLVGTEMVSIVLIGPPGNRETVTNGNVPDVNLSHDVIPLVIALMGNPTSEKSTETKAETSQQRIISSVPSSKEVESNSVEDLKSFNSIVCLEDASLLKLVVKLEVAGFWELILVWDFSGWHVLEHLSSIIGMESIEIVSDIGVMEVGKDAGTTWVTLGEFGDVVESVLNDNTDGFIGGHGLLGNL